MRILKKIKKLVKHVLQVTNIPYYPHVSDTSSIASNVKIYCPNNLYMEENTNINEGAVIMNTRAKFIMKKWSGAAFGLTVVCGNHMSISGLSHKQVTNKEKDRLDKNHDFDKDVIVDEDVWIASNVTLLSGVHLGRCCIVGSGSVVRGSIPPYAIIAGNPAKVIGFRFNPQEALAHEESLFPLEQRMALEELKSNYNKYYIKRIKEIKSFINI